MANSASGKRATSRSSRFTERPSMSRALLSFITQRTEYGPPLPEARNDCATASLFETLVIVGHDIVFPVSVNLALIMSAVLDGSAPSLVANGPNPFGPVPSLL